jgi:hypothetical protein
MRRCSAARRGSSRFIGSLDLEGIGAPRATRAGVGKRRTAPGEGSSGAGGPAGGLGRAQVVLYRAVALATSTPAASAVGGHGRVYIWGRGRASFAASQALQGSIPGGVARPLSAPSLRSPQDRLASADRGVLDTPRDPPTWRVPYGATGELRRGGAVGADPAAAPHLFRGGQLVGGTSFEPGKTRCAFEMKSSSQTSWFSSARRSSSQHRQSYLGSSGRRRGLGSESPP